MRSPTPESLPRATYRAEGVDLVEEDDAGAAKRALRKTSRTDCSDSPTHLDRSSGPLTAMKLTPLSLATALASKVLPLPGDPESSMPLGGVVPICRNRSPCRSGHSMASRSTCLASSNPHAPAHVGDVAKHLSTRRRLDAFHRLGEGHIAHLQPFKHLLRDAMLGVEVGHQPPQGNHSRFLAERFQVGPDVAVGGLGDLD